MAGKRIGSKGGKGTGRGGPPGGINEQGKLWFSNQGTSRGKRSPINWALHRKASGFYQCMSLARHVPARMRAGFCSNMGLRATGRRPGSGVRH